MGGEEQSLATGGVHGRRRLGGRAFELCVVWFLPILEG